MAAALADALIAKIVGRRGSGARVAAAAAPGAALAMVREWGGVRALLADDPWLDQLGVPEELAGAGVEVLRWPDSSPRPPLPRPDSSPRPPLPRPRRESGWRELLGLEGPAATVGVTVPARGVAERGTLILETSPAHGRAIDVVCARHLAILPADRIVATLEEALRASYALGRRPPSAVSLVSGPSRTSDIEKISTLGAHGALSLHVLVVE